MKRYKAIEIPTKPLIIWNSGTFAANDPLVLREDEIPAYQFGVCPLKIVGGELVERTELEMDAFEVEFVREQALKAQAATADAVEEGFFMYGGVNYPMNQAAYLRYLAMANKRPATTNLQSIDGGVVALALADIDAFMEAFYDKMYNLTEPEV
jgi:hypothetical protein